MQKTYFKEEQGFTQPWLWLLLILSMGAMLVPMFIGLYTQLVLGKPWGNQPLSDTALLWFPVLNWLLQLDYLLCL